MNHLQAQRRRHRPGGPGGVSCTKHRFNAHLSQRSDGLGGLGAQGVGQGEAPGAGPAHGDPHARLPSGLSGLGLLTEGGGLYARVNQRAATAHDHWSSPGELGR